MKNDRVALGHSPSDAPAVAGPALSVYVLATTEAGTRAALAAAGSFARGFDTRIVLLLPHVVPYAQALDHPADPVTFARDRYRSAAAALGVDVTIRVCLCRARATVADLIPRDAIVVLGGHARRWCRMWPTREQRLARNLERQGRRVLFIC